MRVEVALVGGVNSAQIPLLIMIVSLLTSKPYLRNCVVFIQSISAASE